MIIKNKQKSFTLIELLVVIVIIGILAGVIMISTSSSIDKANIAKVKVFENSIQNELGANMVSRWKLDEIVGTTTTPDAWGSNTGTLGDGVTASTYPTLKSESECVTGKCMYFDGVDDYIDIENTLLNGLTKFTFSIWFKGNGFRGLFSFAKTLEDTWRLTPYTETTIRFRDNSGNTYNSVILGMTTDWNHFVAVYDASINKITYYMNNIAVASINPTGTAMYTDIDSFTIGKILSTSYPPFNGLIDDVRIYNAALSSSQIKQNYIVGLNSLLANNNISKEEYLSRIENLSLND